MSTQINQITTEATTLNDDSLFPVDSEVSTVFTTKKIKWGTFKSLLNILPLNNTFTGTNRFNKQVKIVSDGTNPPLVVRDSTDTMDMLSISQNGGDWNVDSSSSNVITTFKTNGGTRGREYYTGSGIKVYEWDEFQFRNRTNHVLYIQKANGERLITYDTSGTQIARSGSIETIIGNVLIEQTYSGTNQNASSILDIRSTTKGVLLPRMTTTQSNAISTPATGLEHFDTTADTKRYKKTNGWSYAGLITNTEWNNNAITSTSLATGTSVNVLGLILETSKVTANSDSFDILSFVSNSRILTKWNGAKIFHTVRFTFDIQTGSEKYYRVDLKRYSDNSVVASRVVTRNSTYTIQTVDFEVRTLSATDPFVTDGFYIAIANDTGSSATINGAMQLVIINKYQ